MKLILAGTRPPKLIALSVRRYAEWMHRLYDSCVFEEGDDREPYLMYNGAVSRIHLYTVTKIVYGGALGPDHLGKIIATDFGKPITTFLPDWGAHGKSAGFVRNAEMADYGDALYLVWDGKSAGSGNMKAEMEKRKKPVYEYVIKDWTLGG